MSERKTSESVYLGWTNHLVTVSPEGYQQIIEIVQAMKVCYKCKNYYSEKNPNVAGNVCLTCFLREHQTLTYQGPLDLTLLDEPPSTILYLPYERQNHLFLSSNNHAYLTEAGPGTREDASEDTRVTLNYWKFPRPVESVQKNVTLNLSRRTCAIYGDVRQSDTVLLEYGSEYSDIHLIFFSTRNGQIVQINKRKHMHRRLLAEARAELEATRTASGEYRINGELQYRVYDSDVYSLIVKQVNEARKELTTASQPPLEEQQDESDL